MNGAAGASPAALLLVDFQRAFLDPLWGARNNPGAEARAADLLAHWRARGWPVIHVRHEGTAPDSLFRPGTEAVAFLPGLEPLAGEVTFTKAVNSAFIGTGLEAHLRAAGIGDLVLCGLTTPHCVSTSARMAANLGFGVTLAHDACAAFAATANMGWAAGLPGPDAEAAHLYAVSHLHGEFVTARASHEIIGAGPAHVA
ncbi:cysteine hydrolase family protein [Frigidibacter sp. RF13]|uniref:cysteine hydrolase family protein n=1 Tax=Frigidibacter sp. RF13 TaxID=2997340 RepID=UPI00226FFE5D|nr:cysteine hydrolase family protein [Frigidibacter sp. RF13]MCY1127254.1 cysteine hydrolase family protein [Frigidibacter sp. RF13]